MFRRMLDHPGITLRLNTDASQVLDLSGDAIRYEGEPFRGTVIYTGALDALFGFTLGPLPYRTLEFQFETFREEKVQSHATVNYTMDMPYTRITEFKQLTGQILPGVTSTVKEFSRAYEGAPGQIPYYPIISPENTALYARYAALAERFPNLRLLGRLAEYRYYNMDAIAARALALCDTLLEESHG